MGRHGAHCMLGVNSKMAATLRSALTTVTETMFPMSRNLHSRQRHHLINTGNEMVSNLALQMALYFNVHYSPIWYIACILMLIVKYGKLNFYYKFVYIVIYVIMAIVEIVRLYLGYVGNLQEKVPELAGFWLLTLVLQLPLTLLLLLNEGMLIMPLERAVNIVMTLFVVFETVQGYRVIKMMTEHQVSKFHVQQFDELVEMQETGTRDMGVEEVRFRS